MAERLTGDYRKYMDKNYLGAWDVPEGEDLILTIDHAAKDEVKNERGSEKKLTIHFVEDEKPMILNKVNSESISEAVGSKKVEDWAGNRIAIYVAQVTAFGGTTDALRVRPYAPKETVVTCESCGKTIEAHGSYSVNKIVTMSKSKYGEALCWDCAQVRKESTEEAS